MKKIILITFFTMFIMAESSYGQVYLNFSGGINNSTNKFENFSAISTESRLGYFLGVAPSYRINENIQFLIDFQYSQKGYKFDDNNDLTGSEVRFSYIDIIPEIEYSVLNYLTLGIGVNYGIKHKEQFKFENEDWAESDVAETIKSSDFGLTGKVKVQHNNLFGFIRYNFGLKDIADITFTDQEGQPIPNAKQLNRNLQIGIGYALKLKEN